MNQLSGIIKSITTEEGISLVTVEAAGMDWSTLVIDTADTADYLQKGKAVTLVFKENAVSIAKAVTGLFSIRNRIACTVSDIQTGTVLSSISLLCKGHQLSSVITTNAVKELVLRKGDEVEALIKTTDISLLQPDV